MPNAELKQQMEKTLTAYRSDLATLRAGRANVNLLDKIRVAYYGSDMPISQVATLTVPEARVIVIAPWEKTMLATIEKAISKSDLGITPSNDGTIIRLSLPELTEERRKEFVKQARQMSEKARVSVRNARRDANVVIKKQVKDKEISEDDSKRQQAAVQKVTDGFVARIDEILTQKETDILTV
ncbi:MAG: ribosome recycling factor [Mariprofundales bacterium]